MSARAKVWAAEAETLPADIGRCRRLRIILTWGWFLAFSGLPLAGRAQSPSDPEAVFIDDATVRRALAPAPAAPRTLASIAEALALMRRRSSTLFIAEAAAETTAALRRAEVGNLLPNLSANATAQRDLITGRVCELASLSCTSGQTVYQGGIALVQPLLAPAAWEAVHARRLSDEASGSLLANEKRLLLSRVTAAMANVLFRQRLAAVSRRGAEAALERRSLVREAARLGSIGQIDVLSAEQDLSAALGAIAKADAALVDAQADLGAVVDGEHRFAVDDGVDIAASDRFCQRIDPGERDDVLAASLLHAASVADERSAMLRLWPTLDLVSSYSISTVPIVADKHQMWTVEGVLSVPLWDGGVRQALVRVARANATQTNQRWLLSDRSARREQEQALRQREISVAAVEASRRSYAAAIRLEGLARQALQMGGGTVFALIDAGQRLRVAEADLVERETQASFVAATESFAGARCDW